MNNRTILPPTYLWAAMILMVALHFVVPVIRLITFPWQLVGLLPLVLGAALNLVADKAFRDAKTTVKPFQESTALVTTGAYRLSRHPMYLGFVLILLGLAVLLGSLTPSLVIPPFALLMDRAFIVVEEGMLAQKFGQAWLDYKQRIRRWV